MEPPELNRPTPVSDDVKQPITMLNDRVLVHVPASRRRATVTCRHPHSRHRLGSAPPELGRGCRRGPNVRAIRAGDRVLFNPDECFEVEVQGEDYVILRERDIPAVASERLEDGTGLYL